MRSTLTQLVTIAALVVVPLTLGAEAAGPPSAAGQTAPADHRSSARLAPAPPPETRLLWNDPRHDPHAISDALVALIDRVPAGEQVDVVTYWISSGRIARALRRAVRRDVRVHVLLAGNDKARRFRISARLLRFLDGPGTPGSWGRRSHGAARGAGGLMHQKSYRFSRVGDARWVVVNGSYNSAATSDVSTYALMWQVVGDRRLYDAFGSIEQAQLAQRTVARPLRTYAGHRWSAYFLPTADRPGADPVMTRLRRIPAGRRTVLRIQMYSMWGPRAAWIARRLVDLRRAGARITLVAGPTVDRGVQARLRAGGVRVRPGCFADHTFTHAKDMSATWMAGGTRRYWTWVGSDNWTSAGMASDEAVLGVESAAGYRTFARAFARVTSRRDGVSTSDCRPRQD